MKTIKYLSVLISLIVNSNFYAQIKFYDSYENFEKDIGFVYDSIDRVDHKSMKVYDGDVKIRINFRSIWGFKTEDGSLWRFVGKKHEEPYLVKLMYQKNDSFYYFESGNYHMALYLKRSTYLRVNLGCYVATSLSKDLTAIYYKGQLRKKLELFAVMNPEVKDFVDCCLHKDYSQGDQWMQVRPCLTKIEGYFDED